ncbi:CBD9-like protein [Mollisia scopiformis]|uniref:CBD9-like protein n=1 Tax=Mollisia scopiformis TaxID=149040 RepID=A0A132BAQ4_MOLSC|nr:CBD9-like protein [Mollisia scopiformis]KUJ09458.1 CBD9-like protein [Mollisia scopiformis]
MAIRLLLGALALATAVCGQKLVTYVEPTSTVQYSLAIPETAAAPFDVFASIVAPSNVTWAAIAFGGCMLRSPLVVAWKNDTNILASPRWADAYHPPDLYNGTTVTVFNTSTVNATHWKANILVSGGSSWLGGSVKAFGSIPLGWAVSSLPLAAPATINSGIRYHNVGKGHFEVNMTNARNTQSAFDALKTSPI